MKASTRTGPSPVRIPSPSWVAASRDMARGDRAGHGTSGDFRESRQPWLQHHTVPRLPAHSTPAASADQSAPAGSPVEAAGRAGPPPETWIRPKVPRGRGSWCCADVLTLADGAQAGRRAGSGFRCWRRGPPADHMTCSARCRAQMAPGGSESVTTVLGRLRRQCADRTGRVGRRGADRVGIDPGRGRAFLGEDSRSKRQGSS